MYRIYNPTNYKVVENRTLTFVETLSYSPVTPDVRLPFDEMKNIGYATEVFTLTSLWGDAHNNSIAESEAQEMIFDLVREGQRHNVRPQIHLNTTGANAGVAGVAPMEPM